MILNFIALQNKQIIEMYKTIKVNENYRKYSTFLLTPLTVKSSATPDPDALYKREMSRT